MNEYTKSLTERQIIKNWTTSNNFEDISRLTNIRPLYNQKIVLKIKN